MNDFKTSSGFTATNAKVFTDQLSYNSQSTHSLYISSCAPSFSTLVI